MASLEKSSRRPDLEAFGARKSGASRFLVRSWAPLDGGQLWHLICAYLEETFRGGYDVPPTGANILIFLNMGMVAAQEGDPAVVATVPVWDDGPVTAKKAREKIVGWALWRGLGGEISPKGRALCGMGTYVVPHIRRQGVAQAMHEEAVRMARARGYEYVDRVAVPGTAGAQMLEKENWKSVATVFRKELICTGP